MTNIGILKECPNCSEQLLKEKQKFCTGCGFNLEFRKKNVDFGTPDYFFYQARELAKQGVKPGAEEDIKYNKLADAQKQLKLYLEYLSGEDCIAGISDALAIFETLPFRRHTVDDIRTMVLAGKRIGDMALSIEKLYKSIGVFNAEQNGTSDFSDEQ